MKKSTSLFARTALATCAAVLVCAPALAAEQIVFTSWGGSTQQAQQKYWAQPFTTKTGINVAMDGPTDYGKFKAMVESGNVNWDVVDVEADFAYKAAKDGLLEPIDFAVVPKKDLDPRFVDKFAVGSFYYSFVLGYSKDTYKKTEPATWADLFDLKKFQGKRTFYKWAAPGVLEIALLADGVAPDKLYPLDLDRAFKKLDTIKSQIVWWSGGAQSQQLLASGEAPLGMFWNGRLHVLKQSGVNVGTSWQQNLTAADMLVVPKGAKNKAAAMKYLGMATSPEGQAKFADETGFAPINLKSESLMPAAAVSGLPTRFTTGQINLNMKYWSDNREAIAKRWYAWQAQ